MSKKKLFLTASVIAFLLQLPLYGEVTNILLNPGFETTSTGNWSARGGCTYQRVTSPVHSGSRSGRASNRTATWHGIQQDVFGKMAVGQTYAVSGWVRTGDSNNSTVHLTFQKDDDNGTTYEWAASGTANNSGWTYISGNYTLNVTGTLMGLTFYIEGPNPGTTLYFDDANIFGEVPGPPAPVDPNATGNVNFNVIHQKLDGFGGSGAWYTSNLVGYSEPTRTQLYNILFGELGIDIFRIRNTYGIDSSNITNTAQIVSGANASLGRPIRIMNTSWSPPASLKSNGSTVGGTLAKDANGNYRYADFAQWWRDSLTAWSNAGVNTYYLNMQNEPHWTASWDTCYLGYLTTDPNAQYQPAFAALCANLSTMPNRPLLLAPESQDITLADDYVNSLTAADKNNVYGWSHHLYDGSADSPDAFIGKMANLKAAIGDRPLLQTEFSDGGPFTFTDAINLAKLIHNTMTVEEASAYLYWDLFWGSPSGLVSLSPPTYTINSVYWAMKHYSKYTDPNWYRVDANTSDANSLRISAYKDPCEPNASIVVINTSATTDINLILSLTGYHPKYSGIYQSKADANFAYIGTFSSTTKVLLPKESITTIHLWGFGDCASVQAWGFGLDSDLNGNCYVDFNDLYTMTQYWLRQDCSINNNCNRADFVPADGDVDFYDFNAFCRQWMQCNNPQDANCTPNW